MTMIDSPSKVWAERNQEWVFKQSVEICSCGKCKAGSWCRGQFVYPEEGERPLLEAAIKQRSKDRDWVHQPVCDSYM
jgi:hypothetical protein